MSVEANKALIRQYLADFRVDSGPATLERYIAEDELKQHIAMYNSVLPGYYLDPEDIIAEGDKVVVRAMVRGTHAGPFMHVPPTGQAVAFPLIIIYRIEGGKIVEHWMQVDMLSFMQQIGAMPEPAATTA
ncbi:MAG TPA: ester cyclase [Chloroflexaceae bacterium]|nr:ester cyclase [Chloroflexaceae bacterium]